MTLHSSFIPSNIPVYDAFEGEWLSSGKNSISIVIKPCYDDLTGRMAPSGRIFVYAKKVYVDIKKPEKGHIYIMDRDMLSFPSNETFIIGKITIEADTNGNKVEFYIDDELKETDSNPPYAWQWNEHAIGKHKIKVIAYDGNNKAEDEIDAIVFI